MPFVTFTVRRGFSAADKCGALSTSETGQSRPCGNVRLSPPREADIG
jgi:hypothetical protein